MPGIAKAMQGAEGAAPRRFVEYLPRASLSGLQTCGSLRGALNASEGVIL